MEIKLNSPDYGENFNDGTVSVGATDPQTEFHLFREDAKLTVQTEIEVNLIALDFSTYPDFTGFRFVFYTGSNAAPFDDGTSTLNADGDPIHLMTQGQTRIFISDNGNVGVGDAAPNKLPFGTLQIEHDNYGLVVQNQSETNNSYWEIYHDPTTDELQLFTGIKGCFNPNSDN